MWVDPRINSSNFDLHAYLASIPNLDTLIKSPAGRVALTYADPMLFALTYLPHHLRDPNAPTLPPSFADCHFDWCRLALRWAANRNRNTNDPIKPQEDRIAEVAPRMCGKSTWWFLIVPMWAAAHGHKRFVAAFASTATQAEGHLKTFKNELDNNRYLREDFPDLCAPKRRPRGAVVADRVDTFQAQSGFVFAAKGVDSSNLGMKVEEVRPDLLLMDDVEPDESSYSADLADKRLKTIQDAILQLNIYASVVFVGTVTMPGSIIHQLVKSARQQGTQAWIKDEQIVTHYYAPIVLDRNTGEPRSLWPQKWPLEYLLSIQHTRSYAKNYANDPKGRDGDYWNEEDFTREHMPRNNFTRTAIFIDPATTSTKTSDPAGIAVVSWNPPGFLDKHPGNAATNSETATVDAMLRHLYPASVATGATDRWRGDKIEMSANQMVTQRKNAPKNRATNTTFKMHPGFTSVLYADEVKLTGRPLAQHVYKLIANNPQWNVRRIVVEVTQGGDLWLEVFADSPVIVEVTNPRESKETRFGRCLEYYQKIPSLVTHEPKAALHKLEEQQMAFPKHIHDDIADAACQGIIYFLEPKPRKKRVRTKVKSYV